MATHQVAAAVRGVAMVRLPLQQNIAVSVMVHQEAGMLQALLVAVGAVMGALRVIVVWRRLPPHLYHITQQLINAYVDITRRVVAVQVDLGHKEIRRASVNRDVQVEGCGTDVTERLHVIRQRATPATPQ